MKTVKLEKYYPFTIMENKEGYIKGESSRYFITEKDKAITIRKKMLADHIHNIEIEINNCKEEIEFCKKELGKYEKI